MGNAPITVYQITKDEMPEFVQQIVSAWKANNIGSEPGQKEICTRQVRQKLLEKGHKVSTPPAFLQFIKSLGLSRVKRGKEYWYKTAEVEAVPSRNINP